LQSLCYFIGY